MSAATIAPSMTNWPGAIPIQSSYTAGQAGQRFFTALKQEGRLLAAQCAECRQVYFPARQFCERCFNELTEAVEVGRAGTIASFTFCHFDRHRQPLAEPLALALVRLDGSTTLFLHRLLGVVEPAQVAIGARAEVTLKAQDKREGSILDIEGLRLIDTPNAASSDWQRHR